MSNSLTQPEEVDYVWMTMESYDMQADMEADADPPASHVHEVADGHAVCPDSSINQPM